jgi:protein tyrosine phosphatase (PTP) superfamily phosphohydrolase (DUF442 family)
VIRVLGRSVAGLALFIALGNLSVYLLSVWSQRTTVVPAAADVGHVPNFQAVDERLWRGGAPSERGLRSLADAGVTTVIDLRAERGLDVDEALLDELGLNRVAIPMRDGQTPNADQVSRFRRALGQSDGPVFVHCGAGVGRTGTMVASYLVEAYNASGAYAMRRNLAVGPPSIEQLVFAAELDDGTTIRRPPPLVVAVSRVLDAPRRLWSYL